MKNLINLISLVLCLLYSNVNAQNIETQFGEPFQLENTNSIKIIGSINNNYYLTKVESKELTKISGSGSLNLVNSPRLLSFNSNFNHIKETDIPSVKVNGSKHKLQSIIPGNNCFYINSVYVDNINDKKVRIIQTLKNNTLSEAPTFIDTFDNNSIFLKDEIAEFDYSADSSRILAIHSNPTKKNENYSLTIKVFNEQFDLLWSKIVALPFTEKEFEFKSATISNDGKIYVLGLAEVKSDKRKSIYKIININKEDGIELIDFETDKYLYDADINLNHNNELLCFAFYSETKNSTSVFRYNGIFSMKINTKTNAIVAKQSHIAPEDLLLRLYLGNQNNVKYGLNGFILTNVILKEDGSAIYIAEQRVLRKVQRKDNSGSDFQYYYNSIVVFNLNPDLSLKYCNEILKSQYTVNDLGSNSSFAFCYENDNLHFLFNADAVQNNRKNYKDVIAMNPGKKWETLVFTMNTEGKITTSKLFKDDSRMAIIPRWSKQVNDNLLLLTIDYNAKPDEGNILHMAVTESSYMVRFGQIRFK